MQPERKRRPRREDYLIKLNGGRLPRNVEIAAQAVASAGLNVFTRDDELVQVITRGRRVKVHKVTAHHLQKLITQSARLVKVNKAGDYVDCNCPFELAKVVRDCLEELAFPELKRITAAPIVTLDGDILSSHGFYPEFGLFVGYTDAPLPEYKGVLGRARPIKALEDLRSLLSGFPFLEEADESAAIAAVMSAIQCPIFRATPAFGITSAAPGTGKTTLAEIIGAIAMGRRASALSLPRDEAELEKRLTGALSKGGQVVVFDNISRPLGREDMLNSAVTSESVEPRLLGSHSMPELTASAMLIFTANSLVVVGDFRRRLQPIRLDAKMERPEARRFDFDPVEKALQERPKYLAAACELLVWGAKLGNDQLPDLKPSGFPKWDRYVRGPLVSLGLPDPWATNATLWSLAGR